MSTNFYFIDKKQKELKQQLQEKLTTFVNNMSTELEKAPEQSSERQPLQTSSTPPPVSSIPITFPRVMPSLSTSVSPTRSWRKYSSTSNFRACDEGTSTVQFCSNRTSSGESRPLNFTSARPAWMRTDSIAASRVVDSSAETSVTAETAEKRSGESDHDSTLASPRTP